MLKSRTLFRHTPIRIILYPVVLLLILYVLHFAGDLLTPMQTSSADRTLAAQYLVANELQTPNSVFARDGCTLFPDKLPGHDFDNPCLKHDIAYWAGGPSTLQESANLQFKEDIKGSGPLGFILGPIMYTSVAYLGNNGVSRIINSNWGFGWK
jgi:hypothetical protein